MSEEREKKFIQIWSCQFALFDGNWKMHVYESEVILLSASTYVSRLYVDLHFCIILTG
jgi:hypothetical protein